MYAYYMPPLSLSVSHIFEVLYSSHGYAFTRWSFKNKNDIYAVIHAIW